MKRIIMMLSLLAGTICGKAQVTFSSLNNWKSVVEQAQKENKYIFVDAFTTWCGPCKLMDQQVYADTAVGNTLNKAFIAVKVQMDRTGKDDRQTKSWYTDAQNLKALFQVSAFPTLLFLSPDGKTLSKSVGFADAASFIRMAKEAQDPSKQFNYLKARYDRKQMGFKDYPFFADKAEQSGNTAFAIAVRKRYKTQYLDKLPLKQLLTQRNVQFLMFHKTLIDISDRFFKVCKEKPQLVDSAWQAGGAASLTEEVTRRTYLTDRLFKDGKPIAGNPDWKNLYKEFKENYARPEMADAVFLAQPWEGKIYYLAESNNWAAFADAVDEWLNIFYADPAKPKDPGCPQWLNVYSWNFVFEKCEDTTIMRRSVKWLDRAITAGPAILGINYERTIDTKANVLYKMGRKEEAIAVEQSIVDARMKRSGKSAEEAGGDFYVVLQKMKRGEPTWR